MLTELLSGIGVWRLNGIIKLVIVSLDGNMILQT